MAEGIQTQISECSVTPEHGPRATVEAVVTALDEILAITVLRSWRPNVPSSWHAIQLRRAGEDIDHIPNATASSYHPRGWKADDHEYGA